MNITKRNGKIEVFDQYKITIAVLSALNETKEGSYETAEKISKIVCSLVDTDKIDVETIQDLVEKVLMQEGLYETSKRYILYREERKKDRDYENNLMKQISKLSRETNRDNANIGHSPASKMYQIGSTASKAYYSDYLIPKKPLKMYNDGLIHIHDYDYYDKTINCLSIPLKRILTNLKDYPFDYGSFSNPKRIISAMCIASIILQRASNDIFGGTMFPNLDITIQEMIDEGILEEPTEKEIQDAMQSLLCNLATMASRAGNQIPFSSITFGLSTGKYGRLVSKYILQEFYNGMGKGETFIFPNLTFKCLSGVSFQENDPNYDLYEMAIKVSNKRMNPTFTFLDAECYKGYNPIDVNIMGCRTFVYGNVNGDCVSEGRGNLFPTTINLPRIALLSKGINYNKDIKDFYNQLDKVLDGVKQLSIHRLNTLSKLKAKDIPYLFGTHVYYKSENLQPEDIVAEVLKQGSIAIGYIGIAEAVKCLIGKHHGEDEKALQLALDINKYIRDYCDKLIEETGYNWSTYATPAESTINKVFKDRKDFGTIDGVTDRDFYTNSFHIPVYYPISINRKIVIEGLFHKYNNGGRITYVELSAPPIHNIEGIKQIHRHMVKSNVSYAGTNFPIDECRNCGYSGIFNDTCTSCDSDNILKIRRVSGYLGYEERINESKGAEIKSRVAHDTIK